MKQNNQVDQLRSELRSKEKELLAEIDQESSKLEYQFQKGLKGAAIIGVGLVIGVAIFKFFEEDKVDGEVAKAETQKQQKSKTSSSIVPSGMAASIIGFALQKLIPLAIDKLTNQKTNEHSAESAGRK